MSNFGKLYGNSKIKVLLSKMIYYQLIKTEKLTLNGANDRNYGFLYVEGKIFPFAGKFCRRFAKASSWTKNEPVKNENGPHCVFLLIYRCNPRD